MEFQDRIRFTVKLAWRNVFRNRRRTFLTGLIIGIGLAAMMFTDAWITGMKDNMIESATSSFLGDAQIHRDGFQESYDNELTVAADERIVSRLERDENVRSYTRRVISYGTISSPADIGSILIYGIEPASEPALSEIDESLVEGAYLADTAGGGYGGKGVLVGAELAEELEVEVGDRVVLTTSKAETGELAQDLFRVRGIYRMHMDELDSRVALISLHQAQELVGVVGSVHEIALRFQDTRYARTSAAAFSGDYSLEGNLAQTWPELVPQIKYVLDMTDVSIGVTVVIVFAVIIFGIINTLFMSLYERMFEFGVLRAVGTRSGRLIGLIVVEAAVLALYSSLLGMGLGAAVIGLGSVYGMDLTGVEFAGTTFTGRIYTVFHLRQFLLHPALVFAFTVLVSVYPARYAGRMSVTRALQRTL